MSACNPLPDTPRRRTTPRLTIAAALALAAVEAAAPAAAQAVLTPERVFAAPDLSGEDARGVQLSPDGRLVTFLKAKASDPTALDLWAAPTGDQSPARLLVDSAALEAAGGGQTEAERSRRERERISEHGVVEYGWNHAGDRLLVPVAGELYLVNAASGAVSRRIARGTGEAEATDARFSPLGHYLSFVRDGRLQVAPVESGSTRDLTPKAEGAVRYGVAEFVAQEEFGRDTGYWWSPDDRAVAYTRVDEAAVDVAQRLEVAASGASVVQERFPLTGHANARVNLFIQRLGGGPAVPVDFGGDPDVYLVHADWSADARTLYVQRQTRDQTEVDLLAVDPATGASRVVVRERRKPWVALTVDFHPLKDGGFLWVSERTGFRHLYLYDREGRLVRAVTTGAFSLGALDREHGLIGVDEARGLAYVTASADRPTERQVYAVDYRRGGPLRPLTRGAGWWSAVMSGAANSFIGRYSSYDTPPQTAVYNTQGRRVRWIAENRLDASHPYGPYLQGLPQPQYGQLTAEDGQKLDYILLKPEHFDPQRRYPAIVEVYGGPGRQHVSKAWRDPAERLYLEAGYVVFQLDNRGTANRGLAFEAPIYKNLGSPEVSDQLRGLSFLQSLPYVDPARVGVTGWSYGGFMTLRLMTQPGSGFAAGAAGAAPGDWREYDTHYTEQYLGRPQDDPAAYDRAAILPRLKDLHGRLLLMHGMADDNVQFSNATAIMAALQQQGRTFDLMLYPGQRHGLMGQIVRLQQRRTMLEFFNRLLRPEHP